MARVYSVQPDSCSSRLVFQKEAQLPKSPGAMARSLRTSNRANDAFPNMPEFFNRYSLSVAFRLVDNALAHDMVRVFLEPGFFASEFFEMALCAFRPPLLQPLTEHLKAVMAKTGKSAPPLGQPQ